MQLLFVLNGLNNYILMNIFNCMLCPNDASRFFDFLCMQCFVIELHWNESDEERYEGDRRCDNFCKLV